MLSQLTQLNKNYDEIIVRNFPERDKQLILLQGEEILSETEDYRNDLYNFWKNLTFLADNKINMQATQSIKTLINNLCNH